MWPIATRSPPHPVVGRAAIMASRPSSRTTSLSQAVALPMFMPDSYGYRPNKSALDAIGVTRERCWKYDWVLEFDIRGLFDKCPA
jgi:hypothetical protein